jgi:hypothetical protein
MKTMAQPESKLSRRIIGAINERGGFAWKNHGSEFTMAGLPDVIVCWKGRFIGLEVKMPGKKGTVSEVQHLVHGKIRHAEGKVCVVSSVSEALACIALNPIKSPSDEGITNE